MLLAHHAKSNKRMNGVSHGINTALISEPMMGASSFRKNLIENRF
jgi:hypothetical protein